MARGKEDTFGQGTSEGQAVNALGRGKEGGMVLPYLARYEDLATLVSYLQRKPLGATEAEVKNAIGPDALDWRKVEAYRMTQLFDIDGRLSLSRLGVEFSQADEDGKKRILWDFLRSVRPYNGILEWAYFQKKDQLDVQAVRLKWSTEYSEIDTTNKQRFELAPIFLFSLCEASGLGKLLMGRKGQPTRLDLNAPALESYVSHAAQPRVSPGGGGALAGASADLVQSGSVAPNYTARAAEGEELSKKIFVSHGKDKGPLAQVEEMLKIMGLEPKVAIREPNLARPVSNKVRATMKECSAAIFVFTPDETFTDAEGNKVYKPSENVLHELGAASVQYDDRIVILKEKSIKLPSNISGLAHIPFETEGVKAIFMDLFKELKAFGLV